MQINQQTRKMTNVYDVPADKLIEKTALDLKEKLKLNKPEWAVFVKTGAHKERRPENPDWWWFRAASVLRKIYVDGPVGVQRLRTAYGGRKSRGRRPEEFRCAGGKIIRTTLKEFDSLGFTEKTTGRLKRGRVITSKGAAYLDGIASSIAKENTGAGQQTA